MAKDATPPPAGPDFHEQRSELQEFRDQVLDLWARFGTLITVVLVVAALGLLGYRIVQLRDQESRYASADQLANARNDPAIYAAVAADYDDAGVIPHVAKLREGDLYLHRAITDGQAGDEAWGVDVAGSLDRAQAAYQAVLDDDEADPLFRVNAWDGLANVHESRGSWDEARSAWTSMRELAEQHRYQSLAARAGARLGMVDGYANPIPFPEPAADAASTAPATAEAPAGEGEAATPSTDDAPVGADLFPQGP